ncbi:hypothetical protein B0H17DRAFT_1183904 [Mycena rosella]|uniref:Nephrocystin 3-like N-terminal domain-containing protein n=1 Tax=Mycena rosella TaxID=1033263 RepID=A0AAD7CY80_MYCRO|nr:hypothetical protein B0H17DRAFT_1183904 [Mycena rosella]
MSDHRRSHFRNWIHGKIHKKERESSSPSAPADPASTSPETEPTALSGGGITVDNIAAVLDLVQQIANIIQKVPVIAPAAALMSVILKTYKEVKDTNEKRDALLMNITDLSRDLCSTVLWMDATNHVDLIGRLKKDIETYARLLEKASTFIEEYDNQWALTHLAARTELGNKSNRLVDLAINQRADSNMLNKIHDTVLAGKLESWLQSPDMKQKHLETLQLRKDGTGLWLLEGDMLINWQDNPGLLWIVGRSGTGKSVLSSAVIANLGNDTQLFSALENCPPSPAIAFFYFDFKDKEGQAMNSASGAWALEQQYKSKFTGQTLPTYQDLLKIFEEILLESAAPTLFLMHLMSAKSLIILDCGLHFEAPQVVQKPVAPVDHQPTEANLRRWLRRIPSIMLESDLMQADINSLWSRNFESCKITGPIAQLIRWFRLAACLIVEISHCKWEEELDERLENLPNDLFGIYDRFLQAIRLDSFVYAEAALRWIMFSEDYQDLHELADAISFDFSDPTQYIYKPKRAREIKLCFPSAYLLNFSDNAPDGLSDNSLDNTSRNIR